MTVRRVAADWKHPVIRNGSMFPTSGIWVEQTNPGYLPLLPRRCMGTESEFRARQKAWDDNLTRWTEGTHPLQTRKDAPNQPVYTKYDVYPHVVGERPCRTRYMPAWPEEDLTHLMLYSGRYDEPLTGNAFRTIEELAEELLRMARERPAKGRFYGASDYAEAISIVIDGIKDDLLPEPGESEETFKQRQQETVERYRRPQEAVTG